MVHDQVAEDIVTSNTVQRVGNKRGGSDGGVIVPG